MTHYDLVIRGGLVVDGSGAAPMAADVAVDNGVVAAVGQGLPEGTTTMDASGRLVTPGFIDIHTHYDAQLFWDPAATPSCFHGVTTVVLGNCGFGVAPVSPGGETYLLKSLEEVEEIPYESTRPSVPFGWTSYGEYLDALDALPLGVNVAGYVPHSALRHAVMGERRGDMATSEDRRALVQLLEEGLAAGAIGFSSSRGPNHVDAFGDPVPSRYADDVEIRELVRALQGKAWQINLEHKFNGSHEDVTEEVARYVAFSEGREALTWTPLLALRGDDSWRAILAHTKGLAADGAAVAPQVAPQPLVAALSFYGQASISRVAGWEAAFSGFGALDHASRIERLSDEGFRAQLRAVGYSGHASRGLHPSFDHWIIAGSPSRPDAVGAPVLGLVDDVPRHPVDAFLDLVVADDLKTFVQVPVLNTDSAAVAELVADPGTLIGLGDAGAHVNSIVNYTYTTYVLSEMVRERRWLTIESAVHRLTGQPARFLGITDRGMILPGQAADICIIDAAHLRLGSIELRHDLPGEAPRLFCDAAGYAAVLVNGVQTVADDGLVGAAPGRVLRA